MRTVTERDLAQLFARLGARDPEKWARSQIEESIPQLARYLFLREAWRRVVPEDDQAWIDEALTIDPAAPGGAIGAGLRRVLDAGARREDISGLVRVMQWRLLFDLMRLLDDPGKLEPEVESIAWRLFQVDASERPVAALTGLQESVLETDPTGREMRRR